MFKWFKEKGVLCNWKIFKVGKMKSKITSELYSKSENIFYDVFSNPYEIVCKFEVLGIDNEVYFVNTTIDGLRNLEVNISKNGVMIHNTTLYGKFSSNCDFYLERVQSENVLYKHFGFGTILMTAMLKTLRYYCEVNCYELKRIYGTVGFGGGDEPRRSIPLYLSFDGYVFDADKNKVLQLSNREITSNNRNLEYLIA